MARGSNRSRKNYVKKIERMSAVRKCYAYLIKREDVMVLDPRKLPIKQI